MSNKLSKDHLKIVENIAYNIHILLDQYKAIFNEQNVHIPLTDEYWELCDIQHKMDRITFKIKKDNEQ